MSALAMAFAVVAVTSVADAQSTAVRRVGLVYSTSPVSEMAGPEPSHPAAREFIRAMHARGWVEGQNLILERRSAEGRPERYEPILQELVSLKCDVIVTSGTPMARVARGVTSTVPIVMVSVSDAQIAGLVTSLARPGGNLTGLSDFGPDLEGKRLELLRQAMPKAVRIAVLQSKATRDSAWGKAQQVAAASLGFTLVHAEFGPDDQSGLAAIEGQRPDAVYVGPGLFAEGKRQLIMDFARRSRLPLMGPNRLFVESGGLMSYASEFANYQRGVAEYVDRILRGAKPADLPIQRPQKLKLVVNLKTAKALGLTLPDAFVSRADQRIQ